MLDHDPIPNTVYISGSGFPVLYHGDAKQAQDCAITQAVYSVLVETFDSERKTMFYCDPADFKERFNPISECEVGRGVVKRRVVLLVLGSRFHTYGMLSACEHNVKLLKAYAARDKPGVRITNMTRDAEFPRYYEDAECTEAWLENLCVRSYDQGRYHVLSGDLVSDKADDPYVNQFFPLDGQDRFVIPRRFLTSIQIETEDEHHTDGRVLIKQVHNAFALV